MNWGTKYVLFPWINLRPPPPNGRANQGPRIIDIGRSPGSRSPYRSSLPIDKSISFGPGRINAELVGGVSYFPMN